MRKLFTKRIFAMFLAAMMVLSIMPASVFAATLDNIDDYVSFVSNCNTVQPGGEVTLSYVAKKDITNSNTAYFDILYDTEKVTVKSINPCFEAEDEYDDGEDGVGFEGALETYPAGTIGSITFTVNSDAAIGDEIVFTPSQGISIDSGKFYMSFDKSLSPVTVVVSNETDGNTPSTDPEPTTGYTVTMGEDTSNVVGETVTVPVSISGDAYNAYDMSFTYDASVLDLAMENTNTEGYRVSSSAGAVRVQRYGEEVAAGEALNLTFTAKAAGTANVVCTSAKVDKAANSIEFDAPAAAIADNTTVVTVSGYTVNPGDDFTASSNVVAPGESVTFTPKDANYDYEVKVTVNGQEVTPVKNDDGSFTVNNVNGNVVVTTVSKTGKTVNVTLGEDTTGAATAKYGTDYSFTLTKVEGYTYDVKVTIGGAAFTGFSAAGNVYTIPGGDITGDIVINSNKTETTKYTVAFEGSGAGEGTGAAEVEDGQDYTFTINKAANYIYTVTAKMGENDATVTEENGTYKIEKVTGDLVITIDKVANIEVAVSEYVQMDAKTMFLITVTGTPDSGKVFAYDGHAMYKTAAYGENVYSYLVIVDKSAAAPTAETAKAMITQITAEAVVLEQTYDVNASNKVDINDAQLVYDMYKGTYSDFTAVTVEKFLRADVNSDKTINVQDAIAIVDEIQ